jgi:predicted dienelactone hydrolase
MSLERRGIPTATFVTHAFHDYVRGLCRMQGMAALPIVVISHPIASRPVEELRQKVRNVHADVRAALIQP